MADTLLGIVIENLGSFVRGELATFFGVGELTQKLCRDLTEIRAVLQDAEEKQITSRAVKVWLQNLADAAHVLDDILDECSITSEDNKCITCFHPMKILAQLDIGKRMKEVAKKIDDIAEDRIKYGLHAGVMEHQREDDESRQTTSVAEPKVYGRDRDIEEIVEFLLRQAIDSEESSVYSIVGVGGQGKTTLAQTVFNDERVKTHFDLRIWVCVSDDFSMMKILESILESEDGKNPNLSSLEPMQIKVQKLLLNKRYLLVLDDVWCEDQEKLNKFKILLQRVNGAKGASVLVTTRLDSVASNLGTYQAHRLVGLSDDDIWSLFKQEAFGANREERAELVTIGKELVRKCVGSPLAAKVLGSLLRSESEEHQWLAIKESNFWSSSEDNRVMSTLRLSYYHLKLSLRPCFTFCTVMSDGMRYLTCLETLEIIDCPEFVFPRNMSSQTSLRRLVIRGRNENILVGLEGIPSLQYLYVAHFPSLTSFPDWLGDMTSLQSLDINNFQKLRSLPDSIQKLRNLQKLSIVACPMLEKRYKRGISEDWHKIAHIPDVVFINYGLQSDAKPTCCENIISAWNKMGKQLCHMMMTEHFSIPQYPNFSEFDSMTEHFLSTV